MNNQKLEHLAVFGKNRYHDWVTFFFGAVVFVIFTIIFNIWLYTDTGNLLLGKSEITPTTSQFEGFKKDVDYLSEYLNNKILSSNSISTSSIPRDPSLR